MDAPVPFLRSDVFNDSYTYPPHMLPVKPDTLYLSFVPDSKPCGIFDDRIFQAIRKYLEDVDGAEYFWIIVFRCFHNEIKFFVRHLYIACATTVYQRLYLGTHHIKINRKIIQYPGHANKPFKHISGNNQTGRDAKGRKEVFPRGNRRFLAMSAPRVQRKTTGRTGKDNGRVERWQMTGVSLSEP